MLKVGFIKLNFSRKFSGKEAKSEFHQAQIHLHSWGSFDAHTVLDPDGHLTWLPNLQHHAVAAQHSTC